MKGGTVTWGAEPLATARLRGALQPGWPARAANTLAKALVDGDHCVIRADRYGQSEGVPCTLTPPAHITGAKGAPGIRYWKSCGGGGMRPAIETLVEAVPQPGGDVALTTIRSCQRGKLVE